MIGKKIEEYREEAGLSQEALAEKMGGYNRSTISRWECGSRIVPAEELKKISQILNVEISKFYE